MNSAMPSSLVVPAGGPDHAPAMLLPRPRRRGRSIAGAWSGPPAGTTRLECMAEFIYTMKKVRKAYGDKVVLDDVTMSFYPGAKIGVVGPNGAGKSSILKIMAGLDQPNKGAAFLATGASVGILMQEPLLDETKTVRQKVEEGLGETMVQLNRYNEIAELMATDYSDALME